MNNDMDLSVDVCFSMQGSDYERSVNIHKKYPDGTPTWRELVPLFYDFLRGNGYQFTTEDADLFLALSDGR